MTVVDTKRKMYDLVERGRFGNYPRWWRSIEDVDASGYRGHVSLRSLQVMNPVRLYHVPVCELRDRVRKLPASQQQAGIVFSESPPDDKRGIQGEWDGFNLHYTYNRQPMRLALEAEPNHISGPRARLLLRSQMHLGDYEWLDDLLTDFPEHIIEFSTFTIPVGQLLTNMFVWEVRAY